MRHFGWYVSLFLVALAVGAPRVLAQAPGSKVLVVSLSGEEVPERTASSATDALHAELGKYTDIQLLDRPTTSLLDEMFELECVDLDDECLGKLARKYGADRVFVVGIDASPGGGFALEVKLFQTTAGRVESSFRRVDVAAADLAGMANQAVGSLLGPPVAAKPAKGTVQITANATAARVRVGAVATGETPFSAEVPPGTYPVVVSKEGYQDFVGRVTISAGTVTNLRATLTVIPVAVTPPTKPTKPVPLPPPTDQGPEWYEAWWFWTPVAAIVAGGVVTTALLLTGEDAPTRGDLDISLRPGDISNDPAILRP